MEPNRTDFENVRHFGSEPDLVRLNSSEMSSPENEEPEILMRNVFKSEAAEIVHFMQNAWNLPIPELIISVTGGAKFFSITSPGIHKIFQQDLVSTAMATSKEA